MSEKREILFSAVEVGDGGDGRWASWARAAWPEARWGADEFRSESGARQVEELFSAHIPELAHLSTRDKIGLAAAGPHAADRIFRALS